MVDTPLKTCLLATLRRSGPMPFERYMALCLYHPEFGYYMQDYERTGVQGDYFTSSDLHPIFARLVARQAAEMWEAINRPAPFTWVEMGAGRGLFAVDFLEWVQRERPDFRAALDYILIEPGERPRARLRERLAAGGLDARARLAADLTEIEPLKGCLFSNELVDAFPVAVITRERGQLQEVYVAAEEDKLREKLGPISDPAVAALVARYAPAIEDGQRVEVSRRAVEWMRAVAGKLARGFIITIDYGDLAARLYTPGRPQGTLLAYHGHQTSENFFAAPGEQDLTAHVNFSALIDAGREAGLEFTGLVTQEQFLLSLGEANQFADLYDAGQTETEKLQARLQLKRLIFPEGMGGIFRVLVQHRGVNTPQLTGVKK